MTDQSDVVVQAGDNLYWVNLSMKVAAPSPEVAVRAFIEGTLQQGLRGFAYSVEDHDSREVVGVFDGFGDAIDPLELTESPEAVTDDQDEELLALATRLNETDEPTAP